MSDAPMLPAVTTETVEAHMLEWHQRWSGHAMVLDKRRHDSLIHGKKWDAPIGHTHDEGTR